MGNFYTNITVVGAQPRRRHPLVPALRPGRAAGVFQLSRHRRLARRLGLPEASVGSGFDYIARGEMPAGIAPGRLVRVGRGG